MHATQQSDKYSVDTLTPFILLWQGLLYRCQCKCKHHSPMSCLGDAILALHMSINGEWDSHQNRRYELPQSLHKSTKRPCSSIIALRKVVVMHSFAYAEKAYEGRRHESRLHRRMPTRREECEYHSLYFHLPECETMPACTRPRQVYNRTYTIIHNHNRIWVDQTFQLIYFCIWFSQAATVAVSIILLPHIHKRSIHPASFASFLLIATRILVAANSS